MWQCRLLACIHHVQISLGFIIDLLHSNVSFSSSFFSAKGIIKQDLLKSKKKIAQHIKKTYGYSLKLNYILCLQLYKMDREIKAKIVKEVLNKTKSQDQPQEDKANSIFIARQLIIGDPSQYAKRLLDFKNIKNQNYDKFSERIVENLAKNNNSFTMSFQIFREICQCASEENTTGHQMASILEGFNKYWRKCKISLQAMQPCFNFIMDVYCHLGKRYISICKELIVGQLKEDLEGFREQALKLVHKLYRGSKTQEEKVLPLVYQFDLYEQFGIAKVVQIAMRYSNANEIAYIFKLNEHQYHNNLMKLYIDKCVARESKEDLKRCQTIIRVLKLDPFEFKNMIKKMIGRYINYQLRTHRLYFIQLVVRYNYQLIESLVLQLLKENRQKQAKYFIVHYGLNNNDFNMFISQKQKENIRKIRNILIDNDRFGPTEIDVLEQKPTNAKNTLYMKNFGFDQSNVTFVDEANIIDIDVEREFSGKIGMDTQATGGVHVFDESQMTLLQIFNGKHVYIFDYYNLTRNKHLHHIIKHIFTNCKIYGHDHQKQITSIQKELQLDVEEKVMQELQRSRILDTNKYFKKVFPKQTKSNLVYITEFLLNTTISKYQQCSGWRNRPLRKAQLHYASLDCILPLVLGEKLEEIEKTRK